MSSDPESDLTLADESAEFEALIHHIRDHRGFDFSGYKRSTLKRRIDKRIQTLELADYDDYIDYLEVHANEYTYLFNTILINVTAFFRDTLTWNFVSERVLPQIIASTQGDEPIRIWSAGCATGQEAYTIAMLLTEQLGIVEFGKRVKIYATDLDEDALRTARLAAYSEKEVADVPGHLLKKYFDFQNDRYIFNQELRRYIIFGRHDLMQDAPISKIDLLCCRNTLMYFNSETQHRILRRFQFALKPGGYLVLGKAEMLFSYAGLFTPYDLKRRIFIKVNSTDDSVKRRQVDIFSPPETEEEATAAARSLRFREIGFDNSPVGQIVIDLNSFLVMANERARALLNLLPKDIGRMLQDLDLFHRLPDLRNYISEVYRERRLMTLKEVKWVTVSGDVRYLEVQLLPLIDADSHLIGVSMSFIDMTTQQMLQKEIEHASEALETAYEEMQSTNEELETTNEELQSTIEELETTNEELQSTNEELETINEELQSTNEELQTMNDEANGRGEELHRLRLFLESILSSMRGGVIVLNTEFAVQVWNRNAENLWGLRTDEALGKNFLNLEIGLPMERLAPTLLACLSGESVKQEMTVRAFNRRGKSIECSITCTPPAEIAFQRNYRGDSGDGRDRWYG